MKTGTGGNLTKIKKSNLSAIIETIYRYGPITRIEIARRLEVTLPTVTTTIQDLLEEGIISEVEKGHRSQETSLGRKAASLDIVADGYYVIGVEWSPHYIYCCISDLRGRTISKAREPISPEYEETMNRTVRLIELVLDRAGLDKKQLLGMGLVVPGIVNVHEQLLVYSSAHYWSNKESGKELFLRTGLPTVLESHGRARAQAVDFFSQEEKPDNYFYYFIQSGISCVPVLYGRPLENGAFGAGDVGHTIASVDGPRCVCSHRGCLQAIAGEEAVVRLAAALLKDGKGTGLQQMIDEGQSLDFALLAKAVDAGDYDVEQVLAPVIMYLGISISNFVNFFNPELVVVECLLMESKKLQETLLQVVKEYNVYSEFSAIGFEFQKGSRYSGALGGCAIAIKHFLFKQEIG